MMIRDGTILSSLTNDIIVTHIHYYDNHDNNDGDTRLFTGWIMYAYYIDNKSPYRAGYWKYNTFVQPKRHHIIKMIIMIKV